MSVGVKERKEIPISGNLLTLCHGFVSPAVEFRRGTIWMPWFLLYSNLCKFPVSWGQLPGCLGREADLGVWIGVQTLHRFSCSQAPALPPTSPGLMFLGLGLSGMSRDHLLSLQHCPSLWAFRLLASLLWKHSWPHGSISLRSSPGSYLAPDAVCLACSLFWRPSSFSSWFHLVLSIGFQVRGSRDKPMVYSTLYQKHLEWCFLLGGRWSFLKCTGLRF